MQAFSESINAHGTTKPSFNTVSQIKLAVKISLRLLCKVFVKVKAYNKPHYIA